jgi:cytochrome b
MNQISDHMNQTPAGEQVRVWDISVRVFHWLLVGAFAVAYVTEEDFLSLHSWAGYLIGGLLVYRLIWGFIGPQHARFSDFVFAPRKVLQYLKDIARFKAPRYLGHNPAGGAMIIALLLSLTLTVTTGIALLGAEEHAGPLAGYMAGSAEWVEDVLEEVHEFFANFTLLLVFIHVGGVLLESFLHGENLPRSMVTGLKDKH